MSVDAPEDDFLSTSDEAHHNWHPIVSAHNQAHSRSHLCIINNIAVYTIMGLN
jgi:hypothetical protein